jgi:hypothetical protein
VDAVPHFVQRGDAPVFVADGTDTLACRCGRSTLVQFYDPARFLAIDIQCGQCGAITSTPGLPDGAASPAAVVAARRGGETPPSTTRLAGGTAIIGQEELERLTALYQPRTPASNLYAITDATLDSIAAAYDRLTDGLFADHLAAVQRDAAGPFPGLRAFPLAWAIAHLRARLRDPGWSGCFATDADAAATVHVAALHHFIACWSGHPLFAAMTTHAAQGRFSLHALAPFAAAKCLADLGNRIAFPLPDGTPARVSGFAIAVGPTDQVAVHVDLFDPFEWPHGKPWTPPILHAAVEEVLAGTQARINLRRPGLLLLSPGVAKDDFDPSLIEAIRHAVQAKGRRHRGLMAMGTILLRLQPTAKPDEARFGYGLFPIANRHYAGGSILGADARIGG